MSNHMNKVHPQLHPNFSFSTNPRIKNNNNNNNNNNRTSTILPWIQLNTSSVKLNKSLLGRRKKKHSQMLVC